jgi:hypothetical protein
MSDRRKRRPATTGPLRNIRVLELAGIGPGPFAAMLLSDMDAEVVSEPYASLWTPPGPVRPPAPFVSTCARIFRPPACLHFRSVPS